MEQYDVLVAGAGCAGLCAALQAARVLGAGRVCLVEKNGICGGTTTIGGINNPGIFHACGRQVISGIGWELVEQTRRESGNPLPDYLYEYPTTRRHPEFHIRIDATVFAALADEWLLAAGAVVKYHTMIGAIRDWQNGHLVTLCGKDGLYDVGAKVVIDCTGDANLTKMAGAKVNVMDVCQPGTSSCYAVGYDFEKLDVEEIRRNFEAAVVRGEIQYDDCGWGAFGTAFLKKHGHNANHINGINAGDSEGRTRIEMAGRASLMRLFRFLKKQKGFENLEFKVVAAECGVRETRTIQGLQTITVEDYVSGRVFDNAVCYSYYPIDLHDTKLRLVNQKVEEGRVPTVPLGALIPKSLSKFLVAGRIISSDRLANSALRVQATCMATGQAAGAAAVLAVQQNCEPSTVNLDDLRRILLEHHAIVPPKG